MKTTIRLFFIVLAFLSVTVSPQARATCQDACLTNNNTVQGDDALLNLTTGTDNTALGFNALLSNTTGTQNTGVGSQALTSNTIGGANVAIGDQALYENISGDRNTAIGSGALYTNQASDNTAIGWAAATLNTSGNSNTAVGSSALYANRGSNNCAFGAYAVGANVINSGSNNTALGAYALDDTPGSNNTAIGAFAGQFIGSGDNNILIGVNAGQFVTGSNNIEIGAIGNQTDTGQIRIGKKGVQTVVHIAGIAGSTVASGVAVLTDNLGHLGTVTSSARFKENIQPMDKASEAILALKPVTFRYKPDLDPDGVPQFGLVAEDVEKVNPDLVTRDEQGKAYTVRYEAVNAMLLNEFLKEHRKVESLEKAMTEQQKENAAIRSMLQQQAAQIQKVSAQLELSKPAPQTVLTGQ